MGEEETKVDVPENGTGPAAEAAADNQNPEEDFDKERALETIRKQRESEKKLAKELRDAAAKLKSYEDAERAKAEADKTELQKLQERAQKLESDLQDARETAQALQMRQAFIATAGKADLKFASQQAAEDAFELADLEGVEIDANGAVTGLDEALKKLQKARPYLFAASDAGDGQGTPQRGKNNGLGKLNPEALKNTGALVRF